MATLSVPTNSSTQIIIVTSDYASGFGNKYSFYSAAFATSHSNQLGEAGLGEWYHGKAGFSSTTNTNSNATQAGAGWDNTNGDGGLMNYEIEQGVACTGSGSAFAVADANNQAMQTVHLLGATGSAKVEKYWTIWANGTHAVAMRNKASQSTSTVFPNTALHTTYVSSTLVPSSSGVRWGFAGTNVGVMVALTGVASTSNTASYSANDGQAISGVNAVNNATLGANSIVVARLALDGYEGTSTVTTTIVTNFSNDFITHSGTNDTLLVTTGSKTTSGTDRFGNAGTAWTDGYDPQRGAWILAASANHLNIGGSTAANWGVDGTTVVKRYRPCFIVSSWTDGAANPTVTLGGSAQTKGTDYECYNDTTNSTLYLCLLKDLAGTEGALDVTAGAATTTPIMPTIVRQAVQRAATR